MWHVGEGDLHAYLDGALPLYPEHEAERIRGHLEACAECRERLDREADARARASAVLEAAGPGSVVVPSFEELRGRSMTGGGGAATGPLARYRRLAWAASVVVALGAGWMAGRVAPPAPGVGAAREGEVREGAVREGAFREGAFRDGDVREVPISGDGASSRAEVAGTGGEVGDASVAASSMGGAGLPGAPAGEMEAAEERRAVAAAPAAPVGEEMRGAGVERMVDAEALGAQGEADAEVLQDSQVPVLPEARFESRASRTGADRSLELAALRAALALAGASPGSGDGAPWVACVAGSDAVTALRDAYPAVEPAADCGWVDSPAGGATPDRQVLRHLPTGREAREIRLEGVEVTEEGTAEARVAWVAGRLSGRGYTCILAREGEAWVARSCVVRWIAQAP